MLTATTEMFPIFTSTESNAQRLSYRQFSFSYARTFRSQPTQDLAMSTQRLDGHSKTYAHAIWRMETPSSIWALRFHTGSNSNGKDPIILHNHPGGKQFVVLRSISAVSFELFLSSNKLRMTLLKTRLHFNMYAFAGTNSKRQIKSFKPLASRIAAPHRFRTGLSKGSAWMNEQL